MEDFKSEMPWVTIYLEDQPFALSANYVREMVVMPAVTFLPKTPDYVRGVINLRGKVLVVIDLRKRVGRKSLLDETEDLITMLDAREQDHKNWLNELELSVREKKPFRLARDPHQCAFGKWYDNFTTDNKVLTNCLKKFDAPHKRIHAIADEVKVLEEKQQFAEAFDLIARTGKKDLAMMIELFNEARKLLRETNREIALVLEYNGDFFALAVDSVETVERLDETDITEMSEVTPDNDNDFISGIGKRRKDGLLIQMLDISRILGSNISYRLPETVEG